MATTVDDLKTLKKNNVVQLRLIIGDDSDIPALTRLLATFEGTALCNFNLVDGHENQVRDWTSTEMCALFEAIGNLSGIVHLGFENLACAEGLVDDENQEFPITLITTLLQKARYSLETLLFDRVALTGASREEMEEFVAAIEGLRCLRSCVMTNNFELSIADESHPADAVVTAMSKLPMLLKAGFVSYNWYEEGYPVLFLSADPLKGLFECPHLQELTLGEFNLANEGLKDVGRALASSQSIRRFELHVAPSRTRISIASLTLLANALKTNHTLEVFKLDFDETCPTLDSFLIKVAEALALNSNTVLQKFKVTSPVSYGASVEEAFVKLLRSNYTLQKVDFFTVASNNDDNEEDECFSLDASKRTELELYLRLNKAGRKALLLSNGVSRSRWIATFSKDLAHDLDALHYYVRVNPWLCHINDLETTTPKLQLQQQQQQRTEHNDDMMTTIYQLVAAGFQNTQREIQQLSSKMDDMKELHIREKRQLEKEVQRLREELAGLRGQIIVE